MAEGHAECRAEIRGESRVIAEGQKEALQRRSSKSRLSKQDEVEEQEDNSPSSEASDATIVPTGKVYVAYCCGGLYINRP